METLSALLERLFVWVPRLAIIRATHGGVKWSSSWLSIFRNREPHVIELKPGLAWYWPLTDEVDTIVVARRPVDIPTMSILTKDGESIIISAAVVFRINNVIAALGRLNWDVDSTLVDVTQSVIFNAVRRRTFQELLDDNGDELLEELTEQTKSRLGKFGILVESVLAKDLDRSRTYRMLGETVSHVIAESEI